MKLILSCPSKTFLLGEYSVLNAGSALLINSEPRFQLIANMRGKGEADGIHPKSPAGLWMAQNHERLGHTDIQFIDPHNGLGGFGASSAQFLLVHALAQVIADSNGGRDKSAVQVEPIWHDYRQIATFGARSGMRPSGVDIVSQFAGGICEVNLEPFSFEALRWPFEEFGVVLARTGQKVATHQHLDELRSLDTEELSWILDRGLDAFEMHDPLAFFDAVNDYHAELLEMGLVADTSQMFISTLLAQPFVKAVKGCGALGGDTLAVFFANEHSSRVSRVLADLQLPIVSDLTGVSSGFRMQIDESDKTADIDPESATGV